MGITSHALKSSCCSKVAPQNGKSELCPYVCDDRRIWFPVFISYFFASLLLTLVHSGANLPLVVKTSSKSCLLVNIILLFSSTFLS